MKNERRNKHFCLKKSVLLALLLCGIIAVVIANTILIASLPDFAISMSCLWIRDLDVTAIP